MILRKKCFVRIHDWTVSRQAAPALSVLFYDCASSPILCPPPPTRPTTLSRAKRTTALATPLFIAAPMNNGVSHGVVHRGPHEQRISHAIAHT